jgi:hypothetical protein
MLISFLPYYRGGQSAERTGGVSLPQMKRGPLLFACRELSSPVVREEWVAYYRALRPAKSLKHFFIRHRSQCQLFVAFVFIKGLRQNF